MRTAARLAIALVWLLVPASIAGAQTTGEVSGHIRYADDRRPVSGIMVWVCSSVQVAVSKTDARGFYSFISLAPGRYTLQFVDPANQTYMSSGVRVLAGEVTTEDYRVYPVTVHRDLAGEAPLQGLTSA